MKLKTAENRVEAERREYEKVARQVGVTDFRRHPETGQYLNFGTAMDFRIWMAGKS